MTKAQRLHALNVMDYLYRHRAQLDYPPGDQRTNRDGFSWGLSEQQMQHYLDGGGRPEFDCSEACPWILKCAGAWHWSQPGFTGSHLQTIFPHYTNAKAAGVGALVIFGPGTGHHEAIVHTPDPHHGDPVIWSHGSPGVWLGPLSEMADWQAQEGFPGVTFLSVAHL